MKRGDPSRYYYCVENSNLDGPDFTLAETELVLKLAELHAQCATEAGVAPEPGPMRAVLHLAKSMAAIVLHARMGGGGQGTVRH